MENKKTPVNGYKYEHSKVTDDYSTILKNGRCFDGFYPEPEKEEIEVEIIHKEFVPEELEFVTIFDTELEPSGEVPNP